MGAREYVVHDLFTLMGLTGTQPCGALGERALPGWGINCLLGPCLAARSESAPYRGGVWISWIGETSRIWYEFEKSTSPIWYEFAKSILTL